MSISYRNANTHFGLVAILLHWITALAVVFLFALGLYMTGLDYYDPWYHRAPWVHKSIGLLTLGVLLIRVIWRFSNPVPKPLGASKFERSAASLVHFLLYVILFVVIFSGYLISSADGAALSVFDWFEAPGLVLDINNQEDKAGAAHYYLAWLLIVIAGLHGLAALKHHFIDRDATLRRMIKPNKP